MALTLLEPYSPDKVPFDDDYSWASVIVQLREKLDGFTDCRGCGGLFNYNRFVHVGYLDPETASKHGICWTMAWSPDSTGPAATCLPIKLCPHCARDRATVLRFITIWPDGSYTGTEPTYWQDPDRDVW